MYCMYRQTNLSVPIVMPNIDCAHCVLRVRYMPNKPTESIFHQCADVAFTATAAPPSTSGRVFAFARHDGPTPTSSSTSHVLVELLSSGDIVPAFSTPDSGPEFVEGERQCCTTRSDSLQPWSCFPVSIGVSIC